MPAISAPTLYLSPAYAIKEEIEEPISLYTLLLSLQRGGK